MITLAFFSFFTFFFLSFFLYNYTSFFIAKEDNNKLDYFLFSIQLELKFFFLASSGLFISWIYITSSAFINVIQRSIIFGEEGTRVHWFTIHDNWRLKRGTNGMNIIERT